MPWGRAILAVLATVFVVGGMAGVVAMGSGSMRPDFSGTISAEDAAALTAPFDDVRQGRDAAIIARLAGSGENAQAEIDRIQGLLPPGAPTSSRLTTWRVTTWRDTSGTGGANLYGVHEYQYPDHVVRVETVLFRAASSDAWGIQAFNVNVATHAQLAGRGLNFATEPQPVQAVIAASVVLPIVILMTFLVALFQPGLKPRWLWLIAIALGVGTVTADTGADALSFSPLSVQLFGAGALWSGSSFDGWIFSVATPFGALAYWLMRAFSKPKRDARAAAEA
ncbi:MAG: hypothetical protein JNL81_16470 [Hyphomonadaceae bacterium]|nr:hypothetical protein [Hyphomonadaceae bacterium]